MAEQTLDKPDVIEGDATEVEPEEPVAEEEPKQPRRRKAASKVEEQTQDVEAERAAREQAAREREVEEAREELEKLDPATKPVQWIIGKDPEHGGSEKQYSIYVQDKLPWMPRQQFFALVSRVFSAAIRATGGSVGGMGDIFGDESGGSLIERGRRLTQRDLTDASSFMALAFELIGYSPDFLVDCYVILLDVPRAEREWARMRFSETWDPASEKWGLKDEDHEKIIQTFIDQNYEEIRRFFVVTLPKMGRRVALHEKSQDRESKSGQSKS
jgi:hypothetical protein